MGRPRKPDHRREHGTRWGYQQHLIYNIPPCAKCREAHAKVAREMRAKKRRQRGVLNAILSGGQGRGKLTNKEFKEIMKTIKEDLDNA